MQGATSRIGALALCLATAPAGRAFADGPLVPGPEGDPSTCQRIEFSDGRAVKAVRERYHFTPEAVQAGERTVPRYVDELRSVIRVNRLHLADEATLRKMRPILLVPVGEGVE